MNLANLLMGAARTYGHRPAVSSGLEISQNYESLARRCASLAAGLTGRLGLKRGDHVAVIMKNCPQYLEVLFGLWYAGLTAVPINAKLHPNEFAYILDHSNSKACFTTPDLVEKVVPLAADVGDLETIISTGEKDYDRLFSRSGPGSPEDLSPDDVAWLFYTSGTTGRPKGAMLTHHVIEFMAIVHLADIDAVCEQDSIIHAAPLSHGSGMYVLPHIARAANNVIPQSGGFDSGETLELIAHYPGCSFFFAPTMVHRLINDPRIKNADLKNLKNLIYGGGPMYLDDLRKAMEIFGPRMSQIYGQGEAPMTITMVTRAMHAESDHPRYLERLSTVGIPRSGVEVKVFDQDDRELPAGEIGEVVCRGDIVMAGYWRNPEATAETLRNGWLHTGDMGSFDEEGFLTLKDRSKDLIISGGSNIYPREIEEVLLCHDGVAEVSVVGHPHADWGEEVIAFVVQKPGSRISPDDLDALCLENIARFKRPKDYRFVEALPKNNYGKVLKTVLRRKLAEEKDTDA
jgi:acyl-CoA synthetase (AMP-forming)/AMP-acid ligase II